MGVLSDREAAAAVEAESRFLAEASKNLRKKSKKLGGPNYHHLYYFEVLLEVVITFSHIWWFLKAKKYISTFLFPYFFPEPLLSVRFMEWMLLSFGRPDRSPKI